MRRTLAVAASVFVVAVGLPTEGAADMACMSVNEWAQVDLGMSAHQVQVIADGPGTIGPVQHSGPHQGDYNIDWPACWDSSKKTRAWFNNATDILVDKNVIDA